MKRASPNREQQQFLHQGLPELLNPRQPLYQLAEKIPWSELEKEFSKLYVDFGRPAKPIRLMTALLILKQMHTLSDDEAIQEWIENPYWQFFSGEVVFRWTPPCDSSEMTYFRRRIGEKGVEKIFQVSIALHGKDAQESEVVIDTTVQEKNVTYPTDTKLYRKVIDACGQIARKEEIPLRQSYRRTVKKLHWTLRLKNHPRRYREANRAERKLKTIAGRLVREIERKLSEEEKELYKTDLALYHRILTQKKQDTDKVYSLHEPHVYCMSKGKAHRKYEFGTKAVVVTTKKHGVIVGAMSLPKNDYDGHTLGPALEQVQRLVGRAPTRVLVDEGFKGKQRIGDTEIIRPHHLRQKKSTAYSRKKIRHWFGRRASIEPRIGHLKSDYRLDRNYLKGEVGDSINVMLSAAASNFSLWIRKLKKIFSFVLRFLDMVFQQNFSFSFR
jgi:IS5 family transposase